LGVPTARAFEDQMRATGRTAATIKRVMGSLGAIIADAQERGLTAHNAVRDMAWRPKGQGSAQAAKA
jgi:integrase